MQLKTNTYTHTYIYGHIYIHTSQAVFMDMTSYREALAPHGRFESRGPLRQLKLGCNPLPMAKHFHIE